MFVDIKKYTLTTLIDSDIGVFLFYNLKVFDFLKFQILKKMNTVALAGRWTAELRLFIYFRSWVSSVTYNWDST